MNAVIFDMDGVLFDTEMVCRLAWDAVGEEMGVGKAGYMVLKTLGVKAEKAIEILKEEFKFKSDFDARAFKERARSFSYKYFDEHGVPAKDGLFEILPYLKKKGYKLALASSTSTDSVHHHLKEKAVEKYFDAIICGDMIKKSKPDPDIYLKACEALGEEPANCYAVEDSKNGILSAHRAGCKVIMVPDLWQGDEETDRLLFVKCRSLKDAMKLFS